MSFNEGAGLFMRSPSWARTTPISRSIAWGEPIDGRTIPLMGLLGRMGRRVVALADDPGDDDDLRLRKRVGVAAGILTMVAPVSLPIQAAGHPLSIILAVALSAFSAANLAVLARSRRFDRYVVALITAGTIWVPLAHVVGGGITGTTPALAWAFLVPAYAILSLGPRRAMPWFATFVVSVVGMAVADPWARTTFSEGAYALRVVGWTTNVLLPLSIVFVLLRYTDLRRRIAEARVDELLLNAIPASIAMRLKHGEDRIAEGYPQTTVLFADVAGFTAWTTQTRPERVIGLLDDLFTRFDDVVAAHGIEKLKTMGDAYMAVAGAPMPRQDHAMAAIGAARDMLRAVAAWRDAHDVALDVRIGLASGAAVGGVIGRRRILFDLWGETVNTAARMESSGLPGRIQVAESTMRLASPGLRFVERVIDVKGMGEVHAYLLDDA